MNFTEIHEYAISQANERFGGLAVVSADAIYLAAVICALNGNTKQSNKQDKSKPEIDNQFAHHVVDFPAIKQAVSEMKGQRVQCRDVFKKAFGREPNASESTQVGHQLRALGYVMRRSCGRNLYML